MCRKTGILFDIAIETLTFAPCLVVTRADVQVDFHCENSMASALLIDAGILRVKQLDHRIGLQLIESTCFFFRDIAMPEFSLLFRALDLEMPSEPLLERPGGHFVGIPGPAVRARQAAQNAVNHRAQQVQPAPAQPAQQGQQGQQGQQAQQGQQVNRVARDVTEDENLPNP